MSEPTEYHGLSVDEIIDTIRCRQRYKFIKYFLEQGNDPDAAIDLMRTAMYFYRRGRLHEKLRRQQEPNIQPPPHPILDPDLALNTSRVEQQQMREVADRAEELRRRREEFERRMNEEMERTHMATPVARGARNLRSPFTATELAAMHAAQERQDHENNRRYRTLAMEMDSLQARVFHVQHQRRNALREHGDVTSYDQEIRYLNEQLREMQDERARLEQPHPNQPRMAFQPQFGLAAGIQNVMGLMTHV